MLIPLLLQSHSKQGPMPWIGLSANPAGQKILLAAIVGMAAFQASSNAITATSFNLAALFMLLCFALAAVLLYYLLMTKGIERYRKLEG